MVTADNIKEACSGQDWTTEEIAYLDLHATRLAYTINLIQGYCSRFSIKTILDIGPHFLTTCIKKLVRPEVSISTLGWMNDRIVHPKTVDSHFPFDLNQCPDKNPIPNGQSERFDLIVFAETVEHLYISPKYVLKCLKNLLKNQGGILIIQTPNAVSLAKRLKMAIGINPFELIREDPLNYGHFREYTLTELINYGSEAGLKLDRAEFCNYWQSQIWPMGFMEKTYPPFREGITVAFVS